MTQPYPSSPNDPGLPVPPPTHQPHTQPLHAPIPEVPIHPAIPDEPAHVPEPAEPAR